MYDTELDKQFQQVCLDIGLGLAERGESGEWWCNNLTVQDYYELFLATRHQLQCKDGKVTREQRGPWVMVDAETIKPLTVEEDCAVCANK